MITTQIIISHAINVPLMQNMQYPEKKKSNFIVNPESCSNLFLLVGWILNKCAVMKHSIHLYLGKKNTPPKIYFLIRIFYMFQVLHLGKRKGWSIFLQITLISLARIQINRQIFYNFVPYKTMREGPSQSIWEL